MKNKGFDFKQGLRINIEEQAENQNQYKIDQNDIQDENQFQDQPKQEQENQQELDQQNSYQSQQNQEQFLEQRSQYDENQQYLVPEQDEEKISPSSHKIQNKSNNRILNHNFNIQAHQTNQKPLNHQQSGDLQVEKIIQDVIYRRRQKQRKKQYINNIVKSNYTKDEYLNLNQQQSSFNQNTNHTTKLYMNKQFIKQKINNNSSIWNQQYQLMQKCKTLQRKIKQIQRRNQNNLNKQKNQANQSTSKENNKEKVKKLSKQQSSLQKIKNRLQNALNLNFKLSRRLKQQKHKLSSMNSLIQKNNSINTFVSKKHFNNSSINEQSTIKQITSIISSPSYINKNHSDLRTFRSIDSKQEYNHQNKLCMNCVNNKNKKKSNGIKGIKGNKIIKNDSKIKQSQNKSIEKYKSPILLYNSYSIDQTKPNINKQNQNNNSNKNYNPKKSNIYIQDDILQQPSNPKQILSHKINKPPSKSNLQNLKTLNQLNKQCIQTKIILQNLLNCSKKEQNLLEIFRKNQQKLKQYQDKLYYQAIVI